MTEELQENFIGQVKPVDIEQEMRVAYLDYAMSVIVRRALPDARDGLKPVHRRILYAMHDMGVRANSAYRKSARIVGDVLGKYHPHSDTAVYDAMARMAQDFSLRYMLIDGQGNFGSVDGDNPAAMRYTEARLATIAEEMLLDIEKRTVDWQDNFDSSLQEPMILPARIPNMLLNGSNGIAVGMATNIPPHNLTELCQALIYLIDHWNKLEDVTVNDLMRFVKGPDFPTGGLVIGGKGLEQAYATGKGTIVMRGVAEIEETRNNRQRIVITEIPYQVNKASLLIRIAELVRANRIKDIADLRDETDRNGMSIIVELKRGAQAKRVLNQLFKYTALQSNFGMNVLALQDGEPRLLSLKEALIVFIAHRQEVITRRTEFDLEKAQQRAHILEGLRIALENLDAVINTIRQSDRVEDARNQLVANFSLSEAQAQAILDMQLRRLAALEQQKIEDEYQEILKTRAYLEDLLANPTKILVLIRDDLNDVTEKYGDDRRTQIIYEGITEFNEEDLVKEEQVLVSITRQGYIKRVPSQTYRLQGRGGKGVTGMTTRDEDDVIFLFATSTHDTILYFSDRGKIYSEKAYQIPDSKRTNRGIALTNLINIDSSEKITAAVPVSNFADAKYLVMTTLKGRIKRCDLKAFASVRASGLIVVNLDEDDHLKWACVTSGQDDLILVTRRGQAIRFTETDVRVVGRTASGVNAIRLQETDVLAGMGIVQPERDLLIVTETGLGKRTPLAQYSVQSRYGVGVRTLKKNHASTGDIVDVHIVGGTENISLISTQGKIIRIDLSQVPRLSRVTQGARIINLRDEDTVASVAVLEQEIKPIGIKEITDHE